jgi:outer membrane lipoprotein carrier protein
MFRANLFSPGPTAWRRGLWGCIGWLLLVLPALVTGAAEPDPSEPSPGEVQLREFLHDLKTLRADFIQTVFHLQSGQEKVSSGVVYLARPNRFRWEYKNPDQLIVADGDTVWLYDPELKQVSHRGQKAALRGTPAQLLVDVELFDRLFEISSHGRSSSVDWVGLKPRQADAEFVRIRVAFSDGAIFAMDMEDQFGQRTLIEFARVERNPKLDPQLFTYKPPSGIDVFGD